MSNEINPFQPYLSVKLEESLTKRELMVLTIMHGILAGRKGPLDPNDQEACEDVYIESAFRISDKLFRELKNRE